MMQNKFHECSAFFSQAESRDNKIGLLHCYLNFIKAASSHSEHDLKEALKMIWEVDKRAAKSKHAPIEGKLVQADCHFLGALTQIIKSKYLKAALNMRKSLNFYQSAQKDLHTYTGPDRSQLLGWADYGNGGFNLVLSFLPPSIMSLAKWGGYGGDRELGLALLHRSQASRSFMSPISCLVLLTYYVSIASFTGEPEDTYLGVSESLFEWADAHYPDGVLFLMMKSRQWRCRRDLPKAIDVAKVAIARCAELPSVAVLGHFNTGFCSFFLLDWQQSAFYFDQLIHVHPSGAYQPPHGQPKHTEREVQLIEEEKASGVSVRTPPAKASALTFYACICGINYLLMNMPHKGRWYLSLVAGLVDPKSEKPIDLFARRKAHEILARKVGDRVEDVLLDACELILTWNGTSQMPDSACKSLLAQLDAAEAKRLPHWKIEHSAAVFLYRADMLKGLGDIAGALKQIRLFESCIPQLQSSAKAKADGTIAFGLYMSAFLLTLADQIPTAGDHLKKAQAIGGFDQAQSLAVKMHALGQRIARRKKELNIK